MEYDIISELEFWSSRLKNLWYIYEQLKEAKVRSMASILEITNSAYFNCFKTVFKNVVLALAEAKEINLYYQPLKKQLATFEETDFSECISLLEPIMVVLCLIWANCKYCDQVRIIILLKQICNLLILEVITLIVFVRQCEYYSFRAKNSWILQHYSTVI